MAEGRIRRRLAIVAGIAGLAVGGGWVWARHWQPDPADYPLQGVEASAADGVVDWPRLHAAGADFAYVDATAGVRRDPLFAANWQRSARAGVRRGAVHRWSLCESADGQTTAMLSTVPRDPEALPAAVAVAFDESCARRPERSDLIADLRGFIEAQETHAGKAMLVQLTREVEDAYALSAELDRPVWVIGDFRTPGYADRPWAMWRANALRRVDGADAPMRWNVVRP